MQKTGSKIFLSATDLAFFMGCNHATWLDLEVLRGHTQEPKYTDLSLRALQKKGQEFEAERLLQLENEGKSIIKISGDIFNSAEATIVAMKSGVDIIYQARLEDGQWRGWADFLVKVDRESNLGSWSYEVEDTKFAKHTRAGSVLQITLYSDMLARLQGIQPEYMHIVTPHERESYRVDDFMAYFRLMRKKILLAISQENEITYPHPVELCEICKWWPVCNDRRRKDDHLGFIAGMGSSQTREVKTWGVTTLQSMGTLALPITFTPSRGNVQTYTKLREQARVQLQAREEKRNIHEILPLQEEMGFHTLPAPSAGDIFFDFEGDPFVGSTGREYLFGWVHQGNYEYIWATTDQEEKNALEKFVDTVMDIWHRHPDMHVYHFSAYEPSALKRLMGKYATREDEVDRLLRGKIFIDLHSVLKHAVRAGVEAYSLKEMERMHNFNRLRDLKEVRRYKTLYETLLENDNIDVVDELTKQVVLDYNKEDCLSAESLRNWLEQLRAAEIANGANIGRPVVQEDQPSDNIKAHLERIQPIFDALTTNISIDRAERNDEQQAKWLLANMLDWYRREMKSFWWNYHRLRELDNEELVKERDALSDLRFNGRSEVEKRSTVRYYDFPEQETDLSIGTRVDYNGEDVGEIVFLDKRNLIVGLKKETKKLSSHPTNIISSSVVRQEKKQDAIIRLAEWVVGNDIDAPGSFRAGRDLLLRKGPRMDGLFRETSDAQERAVQWVSRLDNGVLPIQGPPGTGKSHTAARMIVTLIKENKKIGITALSHKVISGLIEKVLKTAKEQNEHVNIVQKVTDQSDSSDQSWFLTQNYADIDAAMQNKSVNIIAGTSFMWSREEFSEAVDVLFVDEAGQLSLIDTLALSHAAKSLVLLGDPQQLQQPQKGHHPEGTEVSALAHILGDNQTIPEDKGVFLDRTWRMHPAICEYVSEMFYSGRLHPMPDNAKQRLPANTYFSEPGIYVRTVSHFGNSNQSNEEVEVVADLVKELSKVTGSIKIITPYNAQVNAILMALPDSSVGTVDKFQGQEAEVIIFSMATSSPADAPRGMEFLYSLNRLNVAVSRAKVTFILVANPALFEPDCHSPHQMKLANALCRLLEKSEFKG